jgi:hypothetical protein
VTPSIERAYPLEQAAEAMRHLAAGKARGKIAVTISPPIDSGNGSAVTAGRESPGGDIT